MVNCDLQLHLYSLSCFGQTTAKQKGTFKSLQITVLNLFTNFYFPPVLQIDCVLDGQSFCLGGQNFWAGLLSAEFSADLKKKSSLQIGLLFSDLLISKKKRQNLETAAMERGVWVGMPSSLGGGIFVWGVLLPFAPLVAALFSTHQ